MDFEQLQQINIGSSILTNVPLWWAMLIMERAMYMWGPGVYKNTMISAQFSVSLKLLLKTLSQ